MSSDAVRILQAATADLEVKAARRRQARLIQHHTWTARTLELAVGGRETLWTMTLMDGNTRQLVPHILGCIEGACEHLACEAVRAGIMTCGFAEQEGRMLNHARALLREFHELMSDFG